MKKEIYDEGFIAVPTGTEYHQQMESLRNALFLAEADRDNALDLLREVAEVDDADDLEEVVSRIKEFIEHDSSTDGY